MLSELAPGPSVSGYQSGGTGNENNFNHKARRDARERDRIKIQIV